MKYASVTLQLLRHVMLVEQITQSNVAANVAQHVVFKKTKHMSCGLKGGITTRVVFVIVCPRTGSCAHPEYNRPRVTGTITSRQCIHVYWRR